ncbi:MAG TPA: HD domain-containing protein [Spirochaetia bacterium]|nr:HD domain-containing protein [Spirochaetia bacterium]
MDEPDRILRHLENDYTEPIRDPVWKHLYLSPGLLKVVATEQFQKLDRIRQLGVAALVYPGATHTRRSHSLGVFHLARRLVTTLVRRNREVPVTRDGVKAFLCAALLHDVGHYPFAHSLKDLNVEAHESLAAREILSAFAPVIRTHVGVEPEAVAAIIDKGVPYRGDVNVRFFWKLLSGVLDPDKLDYLNRDAFFCGVPYGIQDVDFILEEVYPHADNGVAISRKGITALENILFSKYLMYKTVYWHKTVRIATAMIKKAIAMALDQGAIRTADLYGLDDEQFSARFSAEAFPGFTLIDDTRRRCLHKQVLRVPFSESLPGHCRLERVNARLALEAELALEAGKLLGRPVPTEGIIVDVPERLSFDAAIPVIDPGAEEAEEPDSSDLGALFSTLGRGDFPGSLRSISVSARRDPDLLDALGRMDVARRLQ